MSARLLVLGLLNYAPMHGYELRKVIEQNGMDAWSGVLPGSIYHALHQMTKEGLVQLRNTEQSGNRMRAIYAVTQSGQVELVRLLRETWQSPARSLPVELYTALALLDDLPRGEITAALDVQIESLERERKRWVESRPLKDPLAPHIEATYDNGIEHIDVDLRLLHRLRNILAV